VRILPKALGSKHDNGATPLRITDLFHLPLGVDAESLLAERPGKASDDAQAPHRRLDGRPNLPAPSEACDDSGVDFASTDPEFRAANPESSAGQRAVWPA
jgi:hypothetical protein